MTGRGGFWAFGAAVALPKGFDFGDSVCALKLHAQKTATRTGTNDFIVFGKNECAEFSNQRLDLINTLPLKQRSRRERFLEDRVQTAVTIARLCSRAFPAISQCYSGQKSAAHLQQSPSACRSSILPRSAPPICGFGHQQNAL